MPIRNNFFSRNASNVIAGKNKNYKLSNSVSSLFINKKVWKDVKGFLKILMVLMLLKI